MPHIMESEMAYLRETNSASKGGLKIHELLATFTRAGKNEVASPVPVKSEHECEYRLVHWDTAITLLGLSLLDVYQTVCKVNLVPLQGQDLTLSHPGIQR
jgi:hypothetical protein